MFPSESLAKKLVKVISWFKFLNTLLFAKLMQTGMLMIVKMPKSTARAFIVISIKLGPRVRFFWISLMGT